MKKIAKVYNDLEAHLLVISLAFTTILIFIQVIMRYVFNNSLSWSEELARYIFIWQIWLGASLSQKHGEHITMDMLHSKLKGRARTGLEIFADAVMLAFCIFLTVAGFELIASMMSRGNTSVALKIPMWIVYLALPVSQLAMSFRLFFSLIKHIKWFATDTREEKQELTDAEQAVLAAEANAQENVFEEAPAETSAAEEPAGDEEVKK